jgi:polar amino acid transport system substrate-binding protein
MVSRIEGVRTHMTTPNPIRRGLHLIVIVSVLFLVATGPATASSIPDAALEQAILKASPDYTAEAMADFGSEARYVAESVDLNGDGTDEVFVYLLGPYFCGSGGCTMMLFARTGRGYGLVDTFPITRKPVIVLESTTGGWADIVRAESGGGAAGSLVTHRFDGQGYPEASRTSDTEPPDGMSVFDAAVSFEFGIPLLPEGATAPAAPPLRLASDTWPPFTGGPGTQRVALDLVQRALDRINLRANPQIVEWKKVERGIAEGTFDGSGALWRTPEREQRMVFSDPYLENRLVLVAPRGADVNDIGVGDLGGRRVAVVSMYAYGDALDEASGVLFVGTSSDQESLSKLLAGEVEYILIDDLVARYLIQNQPDEVAGNLEIGKRPLARKTLHFALRRDVPRAEEIIIAFNDAIQSMLRDGTYAQVLGMGWIRIDIDGDGLDEMVTLADAIGSAPPGAVYDVFGDEPDVPLEERRYIIGGAVFEGWAAIPNDIKAQGPSSPMEPRMKQGTTIFTLNF